MLLWRANREKHQGTWQYGGFSRKEQYVCLLCGSVLLRTRYPVRYYDESLSSSPQSFTAPAPPARPLPFVVPSILTQRLLWRVVHQFRSLFVSERYTEFEIAWFYFWTLATLLVMFVPRYGFFTETLRERVYWVSLRRQPVNGRASLVVALRRAVRLRGDWLLPRWIEASRAATNTWISIYIYI